jgi:hypothetical protein
LRRRSARAVLPSDTSDQRDLPRRVGAQRVGARADRSRRTVLLNTDPLLGALLSHFQITAVLAQRSAIRRPPVGVRRAAGP